MKNHLRYHLSRRSLLKAASAGGAILVAGPANQVFAQSPAAPCILTIVQGADTDAIDPTRQTQLHSENVISTMCEKLLRASKAAPGTFEPLLATKWEPVGGDKWRITLRQGVKFHNGADFNAEAAKWSLDHYLAEALSKTMFRGVSRVEIVDDHTLDIFTASPNGLIPSYLAGLPSMLEPGWMTSADYSPDKIVGTGPYKFVAWEKGQHVTVEAFDGYWGGRPEVFQTIQWRPIAEGSTRVAALLAGEVDIVRQITPQDVPRIEERPGVRAVTSPSSRTMMIRIRNDIPPFDDPRVRLALNLAVNVEAIIKAIMKGYAVPLQAQTVMQGVAGWDPDVKALPYDPERAKALLSEAGVKPGFQVKLDATKGRWGNDLEVCSAVAGELRKVGIEVEVVVNESGTFNEKHTGVKEFAPLFIRSSGNLIPDIENGLNDMIRIPPNGAKFHSEKLTELFGNLQNTASPSDREVISKDIAQTISTEIPAIFLFNYVDIYGIKDDIDWTPRFDQYIYVDEVGLRKS